MSELTDTEKALIVDKSPGDDETAGWEYALLHRTVETILTDRLAAVTARAEAAEAKIARIETLAEEATERAYFGIALEKMLTILSVGPERAQVPPHWREAAEFAAIVQVPDLRAALADEGDTHE